MPPHVGVLSVVTPLADIPQDKRLLVVQRTLELLLREADKINQLRGTVAVRMLAGNDLGLTPQGWNETTSRTLGTANTYEDSAASIGNTARDRVIGIYGVYVASSVDSVSGLRFRVGGKRTHQWDLQAIIHSDPMSQSREQRTLYAYMSLNNRVDPVIVPANTGFLMQHYVRGGTGVGVQPAELVLLGLVVEPMGGGGAELSALGSEGTNAMEDDDDRARGGRVGRGRR